jgi:hypothetical protein
MKLRYGTFWTRRDPIFAKTSSKRLTFIKILKESLPVAITTQTDFDLPVSCTTIRLVLMQRYSSVTIGQGDGLCPVAEQ